MNYCIHEKGLLIHGWVIMTNHDHFIRWVIFILGNNERF